MRNKKTNNNKPTSPRSFFGTWPHSAKNAGLSFNQIRPTIMEEEEERRRMEERGEKEKNGNSNYPTASTGPHLPVWAK
jgi:hypothetical protein